MTPLISVALAYAERGLPVFPLTPRGKVPVIPAAHPIGDPLRNVCKGECGREGHGFHDASTDRSVLLAWWDRWPSANVGAPTGHLFDVLDVDPRHGGDRALSELESAYALLPRTPEVKTGSGGRHVLFRSDPRVRCSAGRLGCGLDLRGAGGYVVLPPSIHPNGLRYRWSVRDVPLAPWPAWLLALIAPRKPERPRGQVPVRVRAAGVSPYGRAVLVRACEAIEAAREGVRHDTLRARARVVAGYVGSGEVEPDLAVDCLLAAAHASGLPESEARRTIDWALASGTAAPLARPARRARR